MLSADFKLVPVPSADYIAKNKPQRYITGVPIYAVGTNTNGKTERTRYNRAYEQVVKLKEDVVNIRAARKATAQRWRDDKVPKSREK